MSFYFKLKKKNSFKDKRTENIPLNVFALVLAAKPQVTAGGDAG